MVKKRVRTSTAKKVQSARMEQQIVGPLGEGSSSEQLIYELESGILDVEVELARQRLRRAVEEKRQSWLRILRPRKRKEPLDKNLKKYARSKKKKPALISKD